jgi:glycosyltransferase involved in cell wall biosynthesis
MRLVPAPRASSGTPAADPRTPNLFIVGAPKSGTTLLHHALNRAPDVFMSTVKEPGFFTSRREMNRGLDYYLDAYFAKAAGNAIRGESTPWYLYSDLARQRISELAVNEPTKIVILVREPSARARSMHLDQVRLNREARSFEEAIDAEMTGLAAGDLVPDVRQRYVWGGLYSEHIEKWRDQFGSSNVRVVVLEDIDLDPDCVWSGFSEFLGHDLGPSRFSGATEGERNASGNLRWPRIDAFLRSFEGREISAIEGAKRLLPPGFHRRVLQRFGRLNRVPSDDLPAVDAETLERLDAFYREEVVRIEVMLGRSLDVWRRPLDDNVLDTSSRMRILHLIARSHRRGAELAAVQLAEELDSRGHQNQVVALGPALDGRNEPGLHPLVESTGVGPIELLVRVRRVRQLLAAEPVDVVLAHGGWAAEIAALAVPRHGPLLAWQRILGFPPEVFQRRRRWWWRFVSDRCDVGIALTPDLEAEMRRLGFHRPVWIIPNFRQPARFSAIDRVAAREQLRAEIDIEEGVHLIGFVGHLVDQKRPDRALEVLSEVLERGTRAHLVVAGDGTLRPRLESEVRRRGLDESVSFLGHRSDVEHVLGGVDLVLLTSDAEGIPGVLIEALMVGCPVVTYPVGGVAEVVEDGVNGIILSRPDPTLMATEVIRLLDDDDLRLSLGREGRRHGHRFSASDSADVYADGFRRLLAERAG